MAVVTKTNTEKGHTRNLIGIMIDDDDDYHNVYYYSEENVCSMYRRMHPCNLASCKAKAN